MQTQFDFRRRQDRGQSLVELLAGSLVLIPVILFGIDVATVYMGQSMNASICRDAARAAAAGPPASISPNLTPKQRAEAVVRRTQKAEGAIRIEPEIIVTEQVTRTPTLPFGGIVEGTVTVQTYVDVYPPFLLGRVVEKGAVRITAAQTFPFTWVMASTYNTAVQAMAPSGSGQNQQPPPPGDPVPQSPDPPPMAPNPPGMNIPPPNPPPATPPPPPPMSPNPPPVGIPPVPPPAAGNSPNPIPGNNRIGTPP